MISQLVVLPADAPQWKVENSAVLSGASLLAWLSADWRSGAELQYPSTV